MRDLTISNLINLNGCKEFNHLRITNIDDFFNDYTNNLDYYSPPYKILAELEEVILFQNEPEPNILISYKDWGNIIFDLVGIRELGYLRIVDYKYSGVVTM